jgi:hypothetical protein
VAATDELARAVDAAQYETGEGPCLSAVGEQRVIYIADLGRDRRWPRFAGRAHRLGAGSLLACHLSSERGSLSALNLYARAPGAFAQRARTIAALYAVHAATAVEAARQREDLRIAIESRERVGQAVGIVMLRHHRTPEQAFELLADVSQRLNVKVRDLADIVVSTGLDPTDTAELARQAAREAGARAAELHQNLMTGHSIRVRGSTPEQIASARRRAEAAARRAAGRLDRAAAAYLAAADAHDRAALLHDKLAELGRGDCAGHQRQAKEHRRAAATARRAADGDRHRSDPAEPT